MCSFQSANFGSVNQIPPKYAVVKTVTAGLPTTFIDILSINRSFTDHFRDLLCCLCGLPAQENKGVAAIYDCFAIVLINGRNLRQALQNYHAAYVSASDRRDQPVEIRNLSYVGELIKQTSNMERQFAAVFVVCFFAMLFLVKPCVNNLRQSLVVLVLWQFEKRHCTTPRPPL